MSDEGDVCRAQPQRGGGPCPRCGYVSAERPTWAECGVTFALAGARYRVIGVGSTNRYAPRYLHFEDTVRCQRVEDAKWELPAAPCPTREAKQALGDLFKLPEFRAGELAGAYLVEPRAL